MPLAAVGDLGTESRVRAVSWLAVPSLGVEGPLHLASDLVLVARLLAGLVGLLVRYRTGDDRTRRQLLWLLLAASASLVIILIERLPGSINESGFPIILTAAITLIPVAMTVAVLRHHLLDIRFVRAEAWIRPGAPPRSCRRRW